MIFGAIPPPRNFAKIHARGGRGLQPEQPKDSIPPWGAQRNAAARGGGCAGAGRARRKGGGVPRRAGRGRREAGAMQGGAAGVFGAESRGRSFRAAGRKRGAGGAWPREPHKGHVSGATARGGHVAGRRDAGGMRRLSGADAGKARAGAAVYGGRAGYSRGGGPIAEARRAASQDGRKTL